QGIAYINGIGNVKDLPSVSRLNPVVGAEIERVKRHRPVGLAIGILGEDAKSLLQSVIGLDGIAALMTCPRHLHSIVVGINIVGGLVKITVARACDLIIQRSKEFGIDVRRVGVAGVLHHCTDRNQGGIAAVSAAVVQIPAAV